MQHPAERNLQVLAEYTVFLSIVRFCKARDEQRAVCHSSSVVCNRDAHSCWSKFISAMRHTLLLHLERLSCHAFTRINDLHSAARRLLNDARQVHEMSASQDNRVAVICFEVGDCRLNGRPLFRICCSEEIMFYKSYQIRISTREHSAVRGEFLRQM